MALVINDRVKETSTTSGQGTLNLDGASQDFITFVEGIGTGKQTYYAICGVMSPYLLLTLIRYKFIKIYL